MRVLAALTFGFIPWLSWAAESRDFLVGVRTSPDDVVLVVGSAEVLGPGDKFRAVMLARRREERRGGGRIRQFVAWRV